MENYEEYVKKTASILFANPDAVFSLDDKAITQQEEYLKEHPDMFDEIQKKANKLEEIATKMRAEKHPEYIQGLEVYNQILDQIKSTIEVQKIDEKQTINVCTITKKQREILEKLLYVGIPARDNDIIKAVGATGIRVVDNLDNDLGVNSEKNKDIYADDFSKFIKDFEEIVALPKSEDKERLKRNFELQRNLRNLKKTEENVEDLIDLAIKFLELTDYYNVEKRKIWEEHPLMGYDDPSYKRTTRLQSMGIMASGCARKILDKLTTDEEIEMYFNKVHQQYNQDSPKTR